MLLIAAHETRAVIQTRGFWVQLLMMPLMFAIMTSLPRFVANQQARTTYVIVDQGGDVAKPLAEILDRAQPALAVNQTGPVRLPLMPEVNVNQAPAALGEALAPYLRGEVKIATDKGPETLSAAIVIPPDFGVSPRPVQILSVRPVQAGFLSQLRGALNEIMRARALAARGVDPELVAQIARIVAPVTVLNPAQQNNPRDARGDVMGVIAPVAFSVLLFVSVFTVGARLLSGVIEERSNKLVETILSSVTPGQFMVGKLVGIGLVGIIVILAWIGSAGLLVRSTGDGNAVFTALSAILDAKIAAAFVLYFLVAYIMYAAIFLGIGSMADSMQDAQSYMAPLTLITVAPMVLLTPMSMAPHGTLAVVMSWIPLYTPFTMMLRLPAHPPLWEVVGTTITMLAFTAFLLWMMSRLFRVSILAAGATMRPAQIWRVLTGRSD